MSIFVKSVPAQEPRSSESKKIAILYACILVVMAVTQLFTFDDFLVYFQSFGLPLSTELTYALLPTLIVAEVFAIPFLLRMRLSPAFRCVSMFFGWLVAVIWILLTFWLASTATQVSTVGFLGTLVDLTPGWWAVFISLSFAVLVAWSSWGLWPGKRTGK